MISDKTSTGGISRTGFFGSLRFTVLISFGGLISQVDIFDTCRKKVSRSSLVSEVKICNAIFVCVVIIFSYLWVCRTGTTAWPECELWFLYGWLSVGPGSLFLFDKTGSQLLTLHFFGCLTGQKAGIFLPIFFILVPINSKINPQLITTAPIDEAPIKKASNTNNLLTTKPRSN
jgi:hypothetical protein